VAPTPPASDYSDDEFRAFVAQLHRFCNVDLDQWVLWRLPTDYGEVYVSIGREPWPGSAPHHYIDFSDLVGDDPAPKG